MLAVLAATLVTSLQIPPDRGQITTRPLQKFDSKLQFQAQPKDQSVKFSLFTISYQKAEDENGRDEPYLFTAGFKLQILHDIRGFYVADQSPQVFPVGTLDHNNLGFADDHWARSGSRYSIKFQDFGAFFPAKANLYVSGIVTMLFEEDGFNAAQMKRLRDDFPLRLKKSLDEYQKESVRRPQAYIDETLGRLGRWLYDLQAAGYITFFSSGGSGDPDDVGGTQTAFAINFGPTPPKNSSRTGLQLVTGNWQTNGLPTFTDLRLGGGNNAKNFTFAYPAGNINAAPPKSRWLGQALVGGYALQTPVPVVK